ncbi:hypothetical protein Kpol_1050p115 [Vanderwaltozyma polyspora DSM 70294]|uniref:Cytochrome b-c1 complex subunit 2, mitochondrial n=1 Tax=Vanderwaltozyma polyspora (strain ATCC 22028 / DSM 70294 / BCRC 21397 / CBS 2163 / NBRC 10782 / NRRL Y-8283 / UCD 57-17) TaxID=436907 RepID=A7TF09_VANPO|nr:uncharacterized protein Kpol_1050p115 [Vanderwaltozyma polyspora DSM 70294]EDO19255.1 hypothetical protein Kpol_1050p115 [Vanderwaltozyma polyspora DSM 70294]
MLGRSTRLNAVQQSVRRYTINSTNNSDNVSKLFIKVYAGSRYATKDGVSHLLSRFNFHNTNDKSALRFVRESELLGGKFKSTVDREYITLSATFLKEDLPYYVNALGSVLYKTSFRPHELPESVIPVAKHDLAVAETSPIKKAEDLLYNITFRSGLGNPVLYDNVENVSLEDIKSFADKVYTKENIKIVGKGINEADLKKFVNDSLLNSLPTGSSLVSKAEPKTFVEQARFRKEGESVAAIAIPVKKESFAEYEVLSRYLTSDLSNLSTFIDSAKLDKYSDIGLFSLYVKGSDAELVSQNIKKVVSELKKDTDISVAKELTSLQLTLENEQNAEPVELKLDSVKSFKLPKFSYVAVGDVSKLPYLDQL